MGDAYSDLYRSIPYLLTKCVECNEEERLGYVYLVASTLAYLRGYTTYDDITNVLYVAVRRGLVPDCWCDWYAFAGGVTSINASCDAGRLWRMGRLDTKWVQRYNIEYEVFVLPKNTRPERLLLMEPSVFENPRDAAWREMTRGQDDH